MYSDVQTYLSGRLAEIEKAGLFKHRFEPVREQLLGIG
jgi:hypothetical protein